MAGDRDTPALTSLVFITTDSFPSNFFMLSPLLEKGVASLSLYRASALDKNGRYSTRVFFVLGVSPTLINLFF